jgi:hypothetical protein
VHLNDALMTPGTGNSTSGIQGLKIRGSGKEVTKIKFDPSTVQTTNPMVGNLFSANSRVRYLHLSDMSFQSMNDGACCFYFYDSTATTPGNAMNQSCVFERLNFSGNWKRVFGFDGDANANLNSEMTFRNISGGTATYSDAFFRVGGISGTFNQQNQFLNYWFYDSHFILNGGTLFKFDKGGSANFINGSWSAAAGAPASTFISMPGTGNYNNMSATQFRFTNIRFEPKASNHLVIDCALNSGSVVFESCSDLGSLQNTLSPNYMLHKYTGGTPWGGITTMPTVRYVNCHLTGYHSYQGPAATVNRGKFIYEGCYFYRGNNGEMAIATQDQGATAALRWTAGAPRYIFLDCWNINDI